MAEMHVTQRKNPALKFLSSSIYDTHILNFWAQKINPLWSMDQMLGRITKKEHVAKGMVSLTVECNKRMNYGVAGQHHPVIVEIAGRRLERTYSLTRLDATHVQLTFKTVSGGTVSTWLADVAQIGDIIEFGQPYGDMLCEGYPEKDVVLLAAGSGITPMFSMLHQLAHTGQLAAYHMTLMYWVKHEDEAAFKDQFEAWSHQYPNFKYQIFCTQDEGAVARLNEQHVEAYGDLHEHAVFACGPSGFVNSARDLFHAARLFKSEAFTLSPIEITEEGTVTVTLKKSQKIFVIPKNRSILEALEEANERPVYGCRMGICNKCSCNKISGVTTNITNQAEHAEPGSPVRICVNSAKSDLVLDL